MPIDVTDTAPAVTPQADRERGGGMRRTQACIAGVLLLAMIFTMVGVNITARNEWLRAKVLAYDLARASSGAELMLDSGLALEFEDRLLLEDLPAADYDRGGVYLIGNSTAKWAFKAWELPPHLSGLIHNYGIGATGYRLQGQFVRHLVEDDGFLSSPHTEHIILGAHWSLGLGWPPGAYFGPLWQRHGFYTYDEITGIHPVALGPAKQFLRRERARCAGLLGGGINRVSRLVASDTCIPSAGQPPIRDPAVLEALAKRLVEEPDWRREYALQMTQLDQLVQYVREHKATLSIVLLPTRRVFDRLEYPVLYRKELEQYCNEHSIPFVDLSHLLNEDEYWDVNHPNWQGLAKTHAALVELSLTYLRERSMKYPLSRTQQ